MVMFREFKVGDLFELEGIRQVKSQKNVVECDNGIPFVIQSTKNNMVKCHVDKQALLDSGELVVEGNTLVLGVTLPAVSYQDSEFGASQVITARSDKLNSLNGLYIATAMRKAFLPKYSYTNKPGIQKYKEDVIQLPVKSGTDEVNYSDADIDWEYMELRIRELEAARIRELDAYLRETGLDNYELTDSERTILEYEPTFGEFKIGDLFDVTQGRRLKKSDFQDGDIPFVMASSKNNGIVAYLSNPVTTDNNFVTADILGNVFYQDGLVGFGDDNCGLKLKQGHKSEAVYLYLVGVLSRFKSIASYGNKLRGKWYEEQVITLPLKQGTDETNYSEDDIDWDYMEATIRAMEKQVISDVVDYKDAVIAKTKEIVK